MCPKKVGRPTIENPKKIRLEIRLTQEESDMIVECADRLGKTKTDVLIEGIMLVKAELDKK